jgi:hypothetical protein
MNFNLQKKVEQPRGIMENIIFHIIRSLYIVFVVSRACVYKTYNYFVPPAKKSITKPPPNYEEIYKKYITIYANPDKNPEANINIDTNLYDYEKRKEIFAEEKNDCEEQWKRKLLYEYTPRGNVIVYYNPYKHAFVYYSDENSIPYNIMQYVAKKYVVMFRCRDFFIDPLTYPGNPILEVMKKEEEALNVKSKKVKDITKCVDNDLNMNNKDIFATLKSYKTEDKPSAKQIVNQMGTKPSDKPLDKTSASAKPSANKQPIKNQYSNTFIRIGKTCEFNIIQKPPDKNIAIVNSILFGENNIGKTIDFFDTLEISDTVNPFSSQNSVEENIDLSVLKKTKIKDLSTEDLSTEDLSTEDLSTSVATETKDLSTSVLIKDLSTSVLIKDLSTETEDLSTSVLIKDLSTETKDSTPINVEALSKAKSWKEFKSLSSRR